MPLHKRPAVASSVKPLIGLYSESGCGKTHSALLLAAGFVQAMGGTMRDVTMVETEAGRGEAWARDPEVGGYEVIPISGSFSPAVYGEAISIAEKDKSRVIIVDSASHEWEGIGGVLDMAAARKSEGKKGVAVWQEPKILHQKHFMLRLMQTPIPLVIVCMRARYAMEEISEEHVREWKERGGRGKPPTVGEWTRGRDLTPKQSDDILSEMFVHGWIDREHKFHGTKFTKPELARVFSEGELISVETGKRLAAWCREELDVAGDGVVRVSTTSSTVEKQEVIKPFDPEEGATYITPEQVIIIEQACTGASINIDSLKKAVGVAMLSHIKDVDYQRALGWIGKVIEARDRRMGAPT